MHIRKLFDFLLIIGLISVALNVYSVGAYGHFRAPIAAFVPSDTFMDFYNTNYFSYNETRYTDWRSIYLPFVFLVGDLFVSGQCAGHSPLLLRACDWSQIGPIIFLDIVFCCYVGWMLGRRLNMKLVSRLSVIGALFLSMPNLFAMERGNYIILAALSLAAYAHASTNLVKAISASLMINIKQYLVLVCAGLIIYRSRRGALMAFALTGWLLCLSAVALADSSWMLFISNMASFSQATEISLFEKLWFPTSANSWQRVVQSEKFLHRFEFAAPWFILILFAFKLLALAMFIKVLQIGLQRPSIMSVDCLLLSTILFLLAVTDAVGGYGIILIFPFLHLFSLAGRVPVSVAVALLIILCPVDFEFAPVRIVNDISYVSGRFIYSQTGVTFLSYFKPLAILFLLFAAMKRSKSNEKIAH